jgi:glycogen phosphorylase
LNMSTLDGWWCEGYKPEGGWAIGSGQSYEDGNYQDAVESQAIYDILENEVIPLFYTRSSDKLPRAWIRRVKNSIKWCAPQFNTHRMIAEYTRRFYNPSMTKYNQLAEKDFNRAKKFSQWKAEMNGAWHEFKIKDVVMETSNGNGDKKLDPKHSQLKVGSEVSVRALVKLGKINPKDISVELYYGPIDTWGNIRQACTVKMEHKEDGSPQDEHWFAGIMSCQKAGRHGITVRVLPKHDDLVSPYDMRLILWESNN